MKETILLSRCMLFAKSIFKARKNRTGCGSYMWECTAVAVTLRRLRPRLWKTLAPK
jgi:hypothetical protein